MKKFILPIFALTLSASLFSSCDDKDEEKNADIQRKHLVSASYFHYNGDTVSEEKYSYEYDSQGRVIKEGTHNNWCEYIYNGTSVSIKETPQKYRSTERKLNADGSIAYEIVEEENSKDSCWNNYDNTRRIVEIGVFNTYIISSSEKQNTKYRWEFVWENDNITKRINYKEDSDEVDEIVSFFYTNDSILSPIENKVGIPPLVNDHLASLFANRKNYGTPSKSLPIALVSDTGEETKINWTFDADGYPTQVKYGDSEWHLTWE